MTALQKATGEQFDITECQTPYPFEVRNFFKYMDETARPFAKAVTPFPEKL